MTTESQLGYKVVVDLPYEQAVERVTDALKTQGFGVLTSIDVRATLKAKLDEDFRKYAILGACNPPLAFRALKTETDIGLLLPCNVIVYENDAGGSTISVVNPMAMVSFTGNPELAAIADDADARVRQVVDSLA